MENVGAVLSLVAKMLEGKLHELKDGGWRITVEHPTLWIEPSKEGERPWRRNHMAHALDKIHGIAFDYTFDGRLVETYYI